jgi:hypothetical protein
VAEPFGVHGAEGNLSCEVITSGVMTRDLAWLAPRNAHTLRYFFA